MQMEVKSSDSTAAIDLNDVVFNADYNEALIHQVMTAYQTNARQGTKAQKTRSEVRGGGAKPWRQKGTGRARAGTTRAPHWRGGGATFAARPKVYNVRVNKKMYRGAMRAIFSELVRQSRLTVIESIDLDAPKTKLMVQYMRDNALEDALIITHEVTENLYLAARNLYHVDVRDPFDVDPVSLIAYKQVVMTREAIKVIEERLS